jgi:pyruvate dehydrogenase E2 component (dihydrolipoamide acetyltransferase)
VTDSDSADPDAEERVKASPVARRIAKEKGVDLSTIQGSGPGGRIVKSDVKKAAASSAGDAGAGVPRGAEAAEQPSTVGDAAAAGPAAETAGPVTPETAKGQTTYEDLSKLQSTIARRMSESKATAPHFYLEAEIDMSRAVEARRRIKATAGEGETVPSFNDMVVKACALALREHPRANGAYRDGRFELYSRVNVGVAVAAQDALVVPTVFDADKKGLRQIAAESRALAQKVREGTVTPPELSGGTFTVSNLGMYGIDNFSAVINTPQAAILAVGAIKERPVVRDGELTAAHMLYVTLACDHRILYGAPAAEFLARVRTLLEEPLSLAL